jgi:hypothetical protein
MEKHNQLPDSPPIAVDTYSSLLVFVDCAFEKARATLFEESPDVYFTKMVADMFSEKGFQERFKLLIVYEVMSARRGLEESDDKKMSVHCLDLTQMFKQVIKELADA